MDEEDSLLQIKVNILVLINLSTYCLLQMISCQICIFSMG